MKKLEGKVALVTGAARGIGAAIAERLAADADVVAFFASPDARWVTGQVLDTTGGLVPQIESNK